MFQHKRDVSFEDIANRVRAEVAERPNLPLDAESIDYMIQFHMAMSFGFCTPIFEPDAESYDEHRPEIPALLSDLVSA